RPGMFAQHEADLYMPAAAAKAIDGIGAGDGMSQRVHGHMCAALGDLLDRLDDILDSGGIDRGHCAQLAGEFKLFLGEVDRHDIRAHGTRDHDGREPDTAAAVNCYPFSRPDPTLVDNSAEGGDEA